MQSNVCSHCQCGLITFRTWTLNQSVLGVSFAINQNVDITGNSIEFTWWSEYFTFLKHIMNAECVVIGGAIAIPDLWAIAIHDVYHHRANDAAEYSHHIRNFVTKCVSDFASIFRFCVKSQCFLFFHHFADWCQRFANWMMSWLSQ